MPRKNRPPQRLASPTDLGLVTERADNTDLTEVGEVAFVWSPSPSFPDYLRRIRDAAGLSIRAACAAIGVSYAYLARLETGGPASTPTLDRLFKMAEVYGVDKRELLHEAGVRLQMPDTIDLVDRLDAQFAAVVLSDELRPPLLDENAVHYLGDRTKRQWLDFAQKLADSPDPKALLTRLLRGAR